jgi:hypothetical protein
MSNVYVGVLIALLIACSVLSAPAAGYALQLNAEDTSPKIGNTVFLMEIPYVEDVLINETGNGTTAGHNYTSISMQFWTQNGSMAVYVELLYFPMGLPPHQEAIKVFLNDFEEKTGGIIFGKNESYDSFSGFKAQTWDINNPMNEMKGFVSKVIIDDQRVVNIIADPNTFEKARLKIGIANNDVITWIGSN